ENLVEELGVSRSRADDKHVDTAGGKLRAERLTEAVDRKLTRGIFAVVRHAATAEDGTDVDDDRLFTLLKHRQSNPRPFDQGEEVPFHDPPHAFWISLLKRPDRADAGVVHQDIESAEFRYGCVDRTLADIRVGHVASDTSDATSNAFYFLRQRLQAVLAP